MRTSWSGHSATDTREDTEMPNCSELYEDSSYLYPGITIHAMYLHRNIQTRSYSDCCSGKAISITYSFFYPACNAHAPNYHLCPVRVCHIFPRYLINGTIFLNKLLNVRCVLWLSLQLLSETFLILRRIQRDIIINVHTRGYVKFPLCLSEFNQTWIISIDVSKIFQYQNSWNCDQWEQSCFTWPDARAGGRVGGLAGRPTGG
jgi:hypothetical protein